MAKKIIASLLSLAMVAAIAAPLSEDVGQIFKIPSFKANAMNIEDSYNLDDNSDVVIKFQTDISKNQPEIKLSDTTFKYTGKAICPFVSFRRSPTAVRDLTVGTEITVSYENNVNPGTATVIITGINKYKGTVKTTFTITPPDAPAAVTGLKASSTSSNSVNLTWNKVSGAQGYIIYQYDNSKKTWVRVEKTTTASNTYTVKNLKSGTEYKFAVKAYITAGKEISSASYPKVTATTNPATVSGLKAASTSASAVKLTWNKASGADGYIVYRYNTSTKKYARVAKITANTYTDKNLKAGTSYKYAVRAYKTVDGKELLSTTYPQLTTYTNLATVSGFKASSTSANAVKLTWNKVSGAQGYIIYKYDNSKKTWVRVAKTTTTANTYTVNKLSAGTTYKFAVKAYKTISGKEISSASYPQLTTYTNLATVSGLKASSTSTSAVKLTWNKVSGAQGYIIYKYDNSKKTWVRVAKTTTTSNTYTVNKLSAGTTYKFAVKAYKTINGKEISSASYPQLTTSTNPAKVNFILTAGSKKATVKWNKVSGATGYKVYYKTSSNGKWVALKTTTGTSYTKTGLTKGKTYYFTVKAYRTVSGKTYNGSYTAKSVKIK